MWVEGVGRVRQEAEKVEEEEINYRKGCTVLRRLEEYKWKSE